MSVLGDTQRRLARSVGVIGSRRRAGSETRFSSRNGVPARDNASTWLTFWAATESSKRTGGDRRSISDLNYLFRFRTILSMIVRVLAVVTAAALALAAAGTAAAPPDLGEPLTSSRVPAEASWSPTARAEPCCRSTRPGRLRGGSHASRGPRASRPANESCVSERNSRSTPHGAHEAVRARKRYILCCARGAAASMRARTARAIVRIGADGSGRLATGLAGVYGITPTPAGTRSRGVVRRSRAQARRGHGEAHSSCERPRKHKLHRWRTAPHYVRN